MIILSIYSPEIYSYVFRTLTPCKFTFNKRLLSLQNGGWGILSGISLCPSHCSVSLWHVAETQETVICCKATENIVM